MSDEAIEGIELRGNPPSVRQAKKGPLALIAVLVLIVLVAMAYAMYKRAQPAMGQMEEKEIKRESDTLAPAALTAHAPDVIKPLIDEPPPQAQPPVIQEEKPSTPATPVPVAAAPAPVDQSAEEARKRLAQLREQAIQASMEVPLGLEGLGGGLMKTAQPLAAAAASQSQNDPRQRLLEAVQQALSGTSLGGGEGDLNRQADKKAFVESSQTTDAPPAITGPVQPLNPYVIRTGTVIPMVMITGINSDLPGMVTAQVSQDVFDTPAGRWVLIPQGARLVGQYDSRVTYGQNRVLVVWNRLIYPDGGAVEIGGMPGADQAGYSGLADKVDNHYLRIFGSALLLSFISAGYEIATDNNQNVQTTADTAREAVARQMSQVGSEMLRKNLNIQPTIIIRPGQVGTIMVNKDMYLKPWRGQYADTHTPHW